MLFLELQLRLTSFFLSKNFRRQRLQFESLIQLYRVVEVVEIVVLEGVKLRQFKIAVAALARHVGGDRLLDLGLGIDSGLLDPLLSAMIADWIVVHVVVFLWNYFPLVLQLLKLVGSYTVTTEKPVL